MLERKDKLGGRSMFGSVTWCACCCVFVFFVGLTSGVPTSEPIINTKWGPILGKWSTSQNDRPIANFLGIPYALPPVGDLRFKSPQRWNRTWTTIRDGTVDGQKCTQLSGSEVIGSEDCLYLNVFVPMIPGNQSAGLPIMVYVHGGSFVMGSSDSKLYSPFYLLDHDVILVTLNYRLNVLGFFSTTNRASPGNYGLKDIIAALYWVQENIHIFGGNPELVTMVGSSAGSAAIHFLALSDKSKGLFHKYILHSGSALHPWAIHSRSTYRQICLELARMVGCLPKVDNATVTIETILVANSEERSRQNSISNDNAEQDEEMMKCMRTVDTADMLKTMRNFFVWRINPCCLMTPVMEEESEDAVVTMHPVKIIRDRLFREMPAIIEVTKDEGLVKSIGFIMNQNTRSEFVENFERYLPYVTENEELISNTSLYANAIEDFYFNGNLTESNLMYNITEVIGDTLITWPTFRLMQHLSKMRNASVYFAFFTYQGTFSWTFEYDISTLYGVNHADDLNYIFPVLNNLFEDLMLHNTQNDITMINVKTEMWTNFAKYGMPSAWMIPAWPDYRDHHQFMTFGQRIDSGSPDIAVQADFLSARMKFWDKLMANVTVSDVESNMFGHRFLDDTATVAKAANYELTFHVIHMIVVAIILACM